MSIRKRTWRTPTGELKQAWLVDYRDNSGARRAKQFARKKDAEAWQTEAAWQISQGTHTPGSQSITVAKASELWLARARREELEPTTIASYDQHVRLHIRPLIGDRKLNQLTKPIIEAFRDQLVETRSRAMASRVMRSLSGIVAEAERRGFVAQNVAAGVAVRRAKRDKAVTSIPTKLEMRGMIGAAAASADPMAEALITLCIFTGPRASELRGLTWSQIDLKAGSLTIDRRADAQNVIGPPKSAAGRRTIPLAPIVVSALRRWKLRCPKSDLQLIFPSPAGEVLSHRSLHRLHLWPVQVGAELGEPEVDAAGRPRVNQEGQPILRGRYASHALRHCAASLWIEQRVSPKRIQRWMGHSSIQVTFDTYGHLFEQAEADAAIMQAVEREVLGLPSAAGAEV
jgi:integrase